MRNEESKRQPLYYEELGLQHDELMRCADCTRLVKCADLRRIGACPKCGNRRVLEIQGLSMWEWLRIRLGLLRFEHRDKFIKEFSRAE